MKQGEDNLEKAKSAVDRILEVLLCIVLLSMVFVAIWAIFSRLVLKNPSSFTTEYLRYALLWVSLLSAAYCFGTKEHISIDFVKNKFKGKKALVLDVVIELIIIFFAVAILIYGGVQGVKMGMNEMSPTLFIPVGYVYAVLPISGAFTIFYSIINLINRINQGQNEVQIDA